MQLYLKRDLMSQDREKGRGLSGKIMERERERDKMERERERQDGDRSGQVTRDSSERLRRKEKERRK